MQPGAEIARHYHVGQAEILYILEGEFINEGRPYHAGTELNVKPGHEHGPHTTNTGVTFLQPRTRAERQGTVPCVVFPTGLDARENGALDVYHGMADSRVGVARATLTGLLGTAMAQAA
jgi:hypothetical protein